ncbi:helix-turn-helix transcriptional regulator [uncultured Methylobacterium sp.]|jgi:DNA-binding CsgD family transcriptional regulator/PAS domain-containing protein|uniref:helix-turn-helix transcriptional regulator n=1 Tax=uncultured Methylobacterium sp. TaxID=157278 RepID=UPI00262275E5|nr:helix-turn-helix transcriptional regulator [uncultured Methylobacterium sp.]
MQDLDTYSRLVGSIYDRVGQPEQWSALLEDVTGFVGGRVGQLAIFSLDGKRKPTWAVSGFDRTAYRTFLYRHATEDPRLPYILSNQGRVIRAEEGVDERHFRETALFKEVVRPFGIEHSLVSFFAKEADVMATLAAMRDEAAGPFGAEEAGRLALLVPHLRRAFEFYALLRHTGDRAADLASALDLLDAAVILTDSRLRVTHANRSAEALARSGSGLSLDNGSLAFRSHHCSRRLAKAAEEALAAANGEVRIDQADHIAVASGDDGFPYRVSLHPLSRRSEAGDDPRAQLAVVIRTGAPRSQEGAASRLQTLFGLTTAEAFLAGAIASGRSLHAHARDRGVAISTVRTQLRSLFAKTETRRQGELVARLREGLDVSLS